MMADESPDGATARAVAQERGITHLLARDGVDYPSMYRYLATGAAATPRAIAGTFCGRLSTVPYAELPGWVGARDEAISDCAWLWRLQDGGYARERHLTHMFPVGLAVSAAAGTAGAEGTAGTAARGGASR